MSFIDSLTELVNKNPLLATVISLGGAGIVTFWLKDFPRIIYNFLKREFTTELALTSSNVAFHDMMRWLGKTYRHVNFRKLKVSNGRWGDAEEAVTSVGYGSHWIRYKGTFLLLSLTKEAANQSDRDRDTLTILKLGRNRKLFDELITTIRATNKDLSQTEIYKMEDCWIYVRAQHKRALGSVFLEKDKKDLLLSTLTKFQQNESWYIANGIPYQLGILLYGAPGTGKTSLAKAVAGYLNYPIYYLSPQRLSKIEAAMSTLPNKCVVVVEDIDSSFLTHTRAKKTKKTLEDSLVDDLLSVSLSEILNALDGIFSAHGRLMIATTNHVEALDAALVRPGRIDLKVEVGYVNAEILHQFITCFFPSYQFGSSLISVRPGITVASLQDLMLKGKSVDDILQFVCEESDRRSYE